ncbi:MAG: transporter substrate-binding domain-containing protein [Desulfobacter sp.]|nr:MAG: transporter substrate-binding domain-containing protein [Desulfobacter sp.]
MAKSGFGITAVLQAILCLIALWTSASVSAREFPRNYTKEEKAFIDSGREIRVSNEFDWPPFDFVMEGKPAGFGIDLMELLARKTGLKFTYVNGHTWDELTQMFYEGEIDLIHSLSITPERQKIAHFSSPYYHSKYVLIYRSDTRDIHTLNDLEGKILAIPRGWSTVEFFKAHFPGVHILEVENTRQTLEYVDQGKADATVEQEGIAVYMMAKFGFTDLALSGWINNRELQKESSMHFAVLKTNPVLFSILDKALSDIPHSEMVDLKEKWFSRTGRSINAEDVGLTPEERSWLAQKKRLTYCIARDHMPYSDVRGEGQPLGILPDLTEIFSERLGVEFTPLTVDRFNMGSRRLKEGGCDLVPMISKTAGQDRTMEFTSTVSTYDVAIIARENSPFIAGIPDLDKMRTGMVPSSNIFNKIIASHPKLNYIPVSTIEECLELISAGRLDAGILSLPVASYYIRKKGLTNLKVAGHAGIKEDLRIAVAANGSPLHSIMSKAVRSLGNSELKPIEDKWMSIESGYRIDYKLLWRLAGGAGLVFLFILFWNRKLARLNREIASANKKLKEKTRELEYISTRDSLTGLYNRRYIEDAFEAERRRTLRYAHDLALIILDIDYFKAINDTYGHPVGDKVLISFSRLLKTNIRTSDIAGRWGGEEFLIICPETDLRNAVLMARGICGKISRTQFDAAGTQTASFGVTGFKTGDDIHAMISRADHALYLAKSNGRNRVESLE